MRVRENKNLYTSFQEVRPCVRACTQKISSLDPKLTFLAGAFCITSCWKYLQYHTSKRSRAYWTSTYTAVVRTYIAASKHYQPPPARYRVHAKMNLRNKWPMQHLHKFQLSVVRICTYAIRVGAYYSCAADGGGTSPWPGPHVFRHSATMARKLCDLYLVRQEQAGHIRTPHHLPVSAQAPQP